MFNVCLLNKMTQKLPQIAYLLSIDIFCKLKVLVSMKSHDECVKYLISVKGPWKLESMDM